MMRDEMSRGNRMHGYTFTVRELSWPQRLLYALLGLVLLVLAFFFITVALVAGAFLALAVIARWWWLTRRLRREQRRRDERQGVLEGEYRIVDRENAGDDHRPWR